MNRFYFMPVIALVGLFGTEAMAQKVYLNSSDQTGNPVTGGGNEAQYALINANLTSQKLTAAGFTTKVDGGSYVNAPDNANSWGANLFVSIHSNAGGKPNQGHGTSTLYVSSGGQVLATKLVAGLLSKLPYGPFGGGSGTFLRTDLWVLNQTHMVASLAETVFHDCSITSGIQGHPPSESAFLKSSAGQDSISSGLAWGVCSYYGKSCSVTPPANGTITGVVYAGTDVSAVIPGATVTLNTGATTTYNGSTAWSFSVAPGTYTVTASAPGYASVTKTGVVVTAGQTTWASVGLTAATGTITGVVYAGTDVSAVIAGATVTLNTGATVTYNGSTAWSFSVSPGTYTVTASAPGYVTAIKSGVVVTSGQTTWASVGLTLAAGTITGVVYAGTDISAVIAGATVTLNTGATATYNGSTAWSFSVAPGTYTVTASAPGYVTDSKSGVVVTSGQTTWASVGLTAVPPTDYTSLEGTLFYRSGKCIDVNGWSTANGTKIDIWDCLGQDNEKFFLTTGNEIRTQVGKGVSTGTCIDNNGCVQADRNPIDEWACNGSSAQVWRFKDISIKHKGSMKCIDGDALTEGQALRLYDCNDTNAQHWTYNFADKTIRNTTSGQCIGTSGGNLTNGTALIVGTCVSGGATQQWFQGKYGFYSGANANKCMDVTGNGTVNGTAIQIWDCLGNVNQSLGMEGPIHYGDTNFCLDVPGASTTNGTALELFTCNGGQSQDFTLWSPQ